MSEEGQMLRDIYASIAELWCSPGDVGMKEVKEGLGETVNKLEDSDKEIASLFSRFLQNPVSEEEYVELFELAPRCSLYLGSHVFEEPQTCDKAAVSNRNMYMIELQGIYRHIGLMPNGKDLPDYLPLMVEFLSLTAESEDPIREKLIKEYILPYLPPVRSRLEELKTPYIHLLDALERVLRLDLATEQKGVSHV